MKYREKEQPISSLSSGISVCWDRLVFLPDWFNYLKLPFQDRDTSAWKFLVLRDEQLCCNAGMEWDSVET